LARIGVVLGPDLTESSGTDEDRVGAVVSRRVVRIAAFVASIYVATAAIILAICPAGSSGAERLAEWIAVPVEALAVGLTATLWRLRRMASAPERVAWVLLCLFCIVASIATLVWNTWRTESMGAVFSRADALYLLDYSLLASAYGAFFVSFGGSLKRPRFWLDATAILAALMAAFWAVLRGSAAPLDRAHEIGRQLGLPYGLMLATMMTMAAMLWIRTPGLRNRPAILLIVIAGLAEAAWEIAWLAGWLIDADFVGAFYNLGDALCFALICAAAAAATFRDSIASETSDTGRNADTFLPALATLVSIALVAGSFATTRTADAWILVGLVLFSTLLLVARQRSVRRELAVLNHALAVRDADARLTELVRRSTDAIVVVDGAGLCTYASPAAEHVFGTDPNLLLNKPAAQIFGDNDEARVAGFVRELLGTRNTRAETEVEIRHASGSSRVLHVVGSDQLDNPMIGGIVLTIRDVSEARQLEREVLEMSSRERLKLARQLHEGLGQDLTGTAFLLQSLRKRFPDAGGAGGELDLVLQQTNDAIGSARSLAYGLSPLQVARGSLAAALEGLASESTARTGIDISFRDQASAESVADSAADHLYRIAEEAVANALAHSGCSRIEIALTEGRDRVTLAVSDNGNGASPVRGRGLGLRIIGYRARILGGTVSVESLAGIGTRVRVIVPPAVPTNGGAWPDRFGEPPAAGPS
jgi:PAS domain S-box-containing protein